MTDSVEPLSPGAKFPLGTVIVTPAATEWLTAEVIARALARHQSGNWGDVPDAFAGEMDKALRQGCPVMSLYSRFGPSYQIVTSGDRSVTRLSMAWDSGL